LDKNGSGLSVGGGSEAVSGVQSSMQGNDYDLGVSEDSFLGFGAVVNKLIAVAWNNPAFKDIIDYDARKAAWEKEPAGLSFEAFRESYFSEMISILQEHYEFDFPWAFQIKFVFADTFTDTPRDHSMEEGRDTSRLSFWIKDGDRWTWRLDNNFGTPYLLRNTTSLEIPITPASSENNVSLALARYNAIGPAYPFTCS
jgi:hypothetical protein